MYETRGALRTLERPARVFARLAIAGLLWPTPAAAQFQGFRPGVDVRVTAPSLGQNPRIGTLLRTSDSTIVVRWDSTNVQSLARSTITFLEYNGGEARAIGRSAGVVLGTLAGGGLGLGLSHAAGGSNVADGVELGSILAGAALGVLIGAKVGSSVGYDAGWVPAPGWTVAKLSVVGGHPAIGLSIEF